MAAALKFVNLPNLYYLLEGLTFEVAKCAEVLDYLLVDFNRKTGIPNKIVLWNQKSPEKRGKLVLSQSTRIIAEVSQSYSPEKGIIHLAKILEKKTDTETAPVAFFEMHSPSLDIPMRLEIPLRALLKGAGRLRGTYIVYLHALITQENKSFLYYGITKRGWNKRFNEHLLDATKAGSRRLFPQRLADLISSRVKEINDVESTDSKLAYIVTAICAVGLNEDAALDAEEYLVDKYSLSSKHTNGLNMIPGGREGIRALHKLSLGGTGPIFETQDREAVLDGYLKSHPQLGRAKPGIAEKWNDPVYAEAVICARENRLSADTVREIRYLAALGYSLDQIRSRVSALDNGQVSRVLEGRTYARIK